MDVKCTKLDMNALFKLQMHEFLTDAQVRFAKLSPSPLEKCPASFFKKLALNASYYVVPDTPNASIFGMRKHNQDSVLFLYYAS